jgi:CBS domain-containing protein
METRKCKDIMTPNPVFCLPSEGVTKAAELMKKEDVGPIPVVADASSKRLIGIVTDRDIVVRVVAEGRDPRTSSLEDVMERSVVTCHPEDDVEQLLETMASHRVRRVPVVDDSGALLGIIAQADVATRLHHPESVSKVVEEISL